MGSVDPNVDPAASCEDLLRSARTWADQGSPQLALQWCDEAIRRFPTREDPWRLRGAIRLGTEPSNALGDFLRATELNPHCDRCWFELAWAHLRLGRLDESLDALNRSLSLEPRADQALSSRALVLGRLGRHAEALHDIAKAAHLQPRNESHLHNLGVILTALGRHRAAVAAYRRALELNPASAGTHNNIAWIMATSPDPSVRDGTSAVLHARRALAAVDNPAWMDTLAAALAEAGDFDQAVQVEERAYELSEPPNESFQARAVLYRQRTSLAVWRRERGGLP